LLVFGEGGLGLAGSIGLGSFLGFLGFLGFRPAWAVAAAFCCASALACWPIVVHMLSDISFHSASCSSALAISTIRITISFYYIYT
jgi:hypothetical protein